MNIGLPLMKNVLTPLAKSVLVSLGLTAAASAIDAATQKKFYVRDDYTDNLKRRNERHHENSLLKKNVLKKCLEKIS